MRHMTANRQWKVVDERYSGNVFTDDHWYSTHIPRIVRVKTTQTTQKIRKTAQYCANFYAKPSFELLKTWNRVKHRYGEHRRTTAEVPRQKNWWNAQIADVSRKTRNLCVIHAFTRILGSVTGPLAGKYHIYQVGDRTSLSTLWAVKKSLIGKIWTARHNKGNTKIVWGGVFHVREGIGCRCGFGCCLDGGSGTWTTTFSDWIIVKDH